MITCQLIGTFYRVQNKRFGLRTIFANAKHPQWSDRDPQRTTYIEVQLCNNTGVIVNSLIESSYWNIIMMYKSFGCLCQNVCHIVFFFSHRIWEIRSTDQAWQVPLTWLDFFLSNMRKQTQFKPYGTAETKCSFCCLLQGENITSLVLWLNHLSEFLQVHSFKITVSVMAFTASLQWKGPEQKDCTILC